jgi:putative proteasome-type protease
MTYCLGLKTKDGLFGLADTRITSGTETTTAKKIFTVEKDGHCYFIMTSGLRSVRDKAVTYFEEVITEQDQQFNKLYKAVNKFSEQIKQVAKEDKKAIEEAGLQFNLYAIIGGQLQDDKEPCLFLVYPQANWIEIKTGTPYAIIGNSGFGTPVLRRSLKYHESMDYALKCAFLSFDATRLSANDVDYPIDTVVLFRDSYSIIENRFSQKELEQLSIFWDNRLRNAINELPADVLQKAFREHAEVRDNGMHDI